MKNSQNACASDRCAPAIGPLPVIDLVEAATSESISGGMFVDSRVVAISKALYRSERHVLLVGDQGVGKQTAVHELVIRTQKGEIPHLKTSQFLEMDCTLIPKGDSKVFLDALGSATTVSAY